MNAQSTPNLNLPHRVPAEFERFVTLCDGRQGLRSGLQVDISEPSSSLAPLPSMADEQSTRTPSAILDFIASDETLDRCDEIIAASGWRLESYRRNPVFQNAHQYGDVIFTLGKALLTEVRLAAGRPALFQRVQFAVDANPMARIAYGLYKGKFLNAVSVGFIPLRWENGDGGSERTSIGRVTPCAPMPPLPSDGRGGREDGAHGVRRPIPLDTRPSTLSTFRRRYLEQELLEVSAVGIPANPNALQLGLKAGAIEKSDLQELVDLLASISNSVQAEPITPPLHHSITPFSSSRSSPAARDTHARASGVRGDEAQLLQLARDVLQVLRNT